MKVTLAATALVISIFLCFGNNCPAQTVPPPLPNPVLYLIGQEYYSTGGNSFVRYRYGVLNSSSYPNTIFAAAPSLPPCGTNTSSSRTWVDLYDQRGKRLNGFCALGKSSNIDGIWFALPEGQLAPSWIYIELNDRQTNTKYKSNLAETTN
jgi:hypothetical protein